MTDFAGQPATTVQPVLGVLEELEPESALEVQAEKPVFKVSVQQAPTFREPSKPPVRLMQTGC